jgi:hypothetical protein
METKKQFKWFSIVEYEKEQDYLRDMHKAGWKFLQVKSFGMYYFEKCDAQDVVYQLDYNKEGLAQKAEYVQMFADCGWEYIQDYAGYSYFRKPVSEDGMADEIFCDEDSRLQMMERVLKGRMLPLLMLFFCCLLPQFINSLLIYHNYFLAAFLGGILVLYVAIFAMFAWKYRQYRNKTK